jgi:hypothetical protein
VAAAPRIVANLASIAAHVRCFRAPLSERAVVSPATGAGQPADQAELRVFRALLMLQLAVVAFFGVFPFFLPNAFARLTGFLGAEPVVYRFLGAATLGHGAMSLLALRRPEALAALLHIVASGPTLVVVVIAIAGLANTTVFGGWLSRSHALRSEG